MTKISDGGSAFPVAMQYDASLGECGRFVTGDEQGAGGMTLRDYLAAKAFQELIAHRERTKTDTYTKSEVAETAYEYADAMIAARERRAVAQ